MNGSHQSSRIQPRSSLVIGAQSNPCWAFSAYGRKVETAIKYRRQGAPIVILGEECFLDSITRH